MTLEIKNLSVSYGECDILENISFKLEEGTITGLVAPNGTGKTTLFNAIMHFIQIKSGEIYIDDTLYTDSDKDVLALHEKITFFPDQADLYENFSGREHIIMYAQYWSGKENQVDDIIRRLRMESYVDRKVQEYSLGMRQRLCFAMVVAANTPIMFMDEVMNGLDPENVSLVSDVLIELRAEGKIIMIASHLLDNLDEYADKVFFLKDKQLYRINDLNQPQDLYYKVLVNERQIEDLEKAGYLEDGAMQLSNSLLCLPVAQMSETEEVELLKTLRRMNVDTIEIGALGTSEYYAYIYGLRIHSFDRSENR